MLYYIWLMRKKWPSPAESVVSSSNYVPRNKCLLLFSTEIFRSAKAISYWCSSHKNASRRLNMNIDNKAWTRSSSHEIFWAPSLTVSKKSTTRNVICWLSECCAPLFFAFAMLNCFAMTLYTLSCWHKLKILSDGKHGRKRYETQKQNKWKKEVSLRGQTRAPIHSIDCFHPVQIHSTSQFNINDLTCQVETVGAYLSMAVSAHWRVLR